MRARLLLLGAPTASSLGLCSLLLRLWLMKRMLGGHFSDPVLVPRVRLTLVCCSGFEAQQKETEEELASYGPEHGLNKIHQAYVST